MEPFQPFQAVKLGVDKEFQLAIDEFFRGSPETLFVGKDKYRLPYSPSHLFVHCKFWRLAVEGSNNNGYKDIFIEHRIDVEKDLEFQKAWLLANGLALPGMVTTQDNEYLDYLMYDSLLSLPPSGMKSLTLWSQLRAGDRIVGIFKDKWYSGTFMSVDDFLVVQYDVDDGHGTQYSVCHHNLDKIQLPKESQDVVTTRPPNQATLKKLQAQCCFKCVRPHLNI